MCLLLRHSPALLNLINLEIMPQEYYILIIGYIFGFYMAWNIGANDVANSMASSVGANAITIRQAIFLAGILNIIGAVFIGSHVTNTIRKGIVSTDIMADPHVALIGALSALLAAAIWVSFATWKSLPVSLWALCSVLELWPEDLQPSIGASSLQWY